MNSTVFIWNNNVTGFAKYSGHASLNIGSLPVVKFGQDQVRNFVSWMPGAANMSHSGKTAGLPHPNILHDLHFERYAPDHIIQFPTDPENESNMRRAWENIRNKRSISDKRVHKLEPAPSYDRYWKNCSTIVQRVLKNGDMKLALNPLQWNLIRHRPVWTPLDIRDLALSYKGAKKIQWADWVEKQNISLNEKRLLKFLQKRDARHGSSNAASRHYSTLNVRLLHSIGFAKKSEYTNRIILTAAKEIGEGRIVQFTVREHAGNQPGLEQKISFEQVIEALELKRYGFFRT